jgi:uncharacterized protein YecT (DUF1311 family)
MKKLNLVIAPLLISGSAMAATPSVHSCDIDDSIDRADCLQSLLVRADADLQAAHNRVNGTAGIVGIDYLIKAIQDNSNKALREFRQYRAAACDLQTSISIGGTRQGNAIAECLVEMTQRRTVEVNKVADELDTEH